MKNVLIDFSHINAKCGFGEISRNYYKELIKMSLPDINFVFMIPEAFVGQVTEGFDYITKEQPTKDLKRLNKKIDLWHATDQLFKFRKRDKGTIQLLTLHDLNFLYEKKGFHKLKHKILMKRKVRNSDYVTTISDFVRNDLERFMDMSQIPHSTLVNAISDVEEQDRVRPSFITDDNEKFFFTIGQIRAKKNFHTLVPMMKHFPDYKLYICGDTHFKYSETVQQTIDECGAKNVFLKGIITDAEKNWMYAHSAGFLFPSKHEGFGLPVLEAMRFGCQVFSSKFSSLPEVCGKYATYFDDYEPKAMANVVSEALSKWDKDSDFAKEMIAYSKQFNYKKYAEEYIALYRQLLA